MIPNLPPKLVLPTTIGENQFHKYTARRNAFVTTRPVHRLPAIISGVSPRGKFITFEGLDGSGKSTQMRKLAEALRAAGHKVIETREPGGTATGEKIRKVLLDSGTAGLSPQAEMALMFASRAQHIAEVIEPGLAAGNIVLCDRFTDSTEAYQGSGRRLGTPRPCSNCIACSAEICSRS